MYSNSVIIPLSAASFLIIMIDDDDDDDTQTIIIKNEILGEARTRFCIGLGLYVYDWSSDKSNR